jgi:Flp pilus assembly protein TadD
MLRFWRAAIGLALSTVLAAAPAGAEWRRAESPNFIVYGTISESQLRARILLLEDFDRLMRFVTSVSATPAPNKLHVYIVNGHDDLVTIRSVPTGISGLYTATPDGIAALVDGRAEAGGNETLLHEYAHHFMMQYRPGAYPAWYIEGFAEYFMTVRFTSRRIDIGNFSRGRVSSIVEGRWLPMDQMLSVQPMGLGREARQVYYAQAWLLVHYFFSSAERQAMLQRYLDAIRGDNPQEALLAATGMTPEAFAQELRRYIAGGSIRYRQMERTPGESPPAVTVTTLPAAANDLMLYEAALRVGLSEERGREYLPLIRAAAARHQGDPFAQRVLAHAELLYGDAAAADRLLDPLLAANPADAELMYFKGMRFLVVAQREEDWDTNARAARTWFSRAHRADANHYQTLMRYAESMHREPGYVSENSSNILMLAHELAPQVSSITMNAAALLMARGEYAQAAALLRPLAADPHDAGLAQAARQLLEAALAGRRPGRRRAPDPPAEPPPPN